MIINQSEEIDNKNFTPNFEKSFGIKDEAFILQILRTNTYSDPIGSICREVISNCRDSHREAGKAEIPVEVELLEDELSNSKRQLVFRDFGVGLSPERMNEVYSVYGESTKRNSNQFTGGFGLGAKTPFAYTDSFQVKTVYNFIEYTYQLVIGKSWKGKIIEISKVQSDKQNQTEVIIPLQDKDVITFTEKLINTVQFWNPLPKFTGFENVNYKMVEKFFQTLTHNKILYENKFGRLVKDENYNLHKINVLVDKIIYPLNFNSLKRNFELDRLQNNLVIEFDNGELDLSVSREQLYYSKRTITKVQRRLDNFINLAFSQFRSEMDSLTTTKEKSNWYNEKSNEFQCLKNNISKVKTSLYKFEDSLLLKSINHLVNYSQNYNETKSQFQNKIRNFETYLITLYHSGSFYQTNWWKFPVIIKSYRDKKTDAKIETLKIKYTEGFIIASKIPLRTFLNNKDYWRKDKKDYIEKGKKDIHVLGDYFNLESYRSIEKIKLPRVKREKNDNIIIDKSKKTFSGFKVKDNSLETGRIHRNDINKNRTNIIVSANDLYLKDYFNGLSLKEIWDGQIYWFHSLMTFLDTDNKQYDLVFLLSSEVDSFTKVFPNSITIEEFLKQKVDKDLKNKLVSSYILKVNKLQDVQKLDYSKLQDYRRYDLSLENLVLLVYNKFKSELKHNSKLERLNKLIDKKIHYEINLFNLKVFNLLYYITGRKIFTKSFEKTKGFIDTSKFILINYIDKYRLETIIEHHLDQITEYIKKGLGD